MTYNLGIRDKDSPFSLSYFNLIKIIPNRYTQGAHLPDDSNFCQVKIYN